MAALIGIRHLDEGSPKEIQTRLGLRGDMMTVAEAHLLNFARFGTFPEQVDHSILRTLRVLLQFAVDEGQIDLSPAAKFRQFYTPPRQALWSNQQEEKYLAAANAMGRPGMVLAYALGVYTAQGSGDVVTLCWSAYDGQAIRIRQGKTKKLLEITAFSALKALLDTSPRTNTQILVSEATSKPYSEHHFRHTFASVMKEADSKAFAINI